MADALQAIIEAQRNARFADMHVMETSASVEVGIEVDERRCLALGRALADAPHASRFDEEICPSSSLKDEDFLRALLWATAICHATKGAFRGKSAGREIKGWDYLLRAIMDAAETDPSSISPEAMNHIGPADLVRLLSRPRFDGTVNLGDSARRAEILRDLAGWLIQDFGGAALSVFRRANFRLAAEGGLYAELRSAPGFQDPYHKKTSVLVGTAHYSHRFAFSDIENFVPMTDYHVMRVLCRTGCVVVSDTSLVRRLKLQLPVEPGEEECIRRSAIEACRLAASGGPVSTVELNMLLWAHARSLCRYQPVCESKMPEHDSFRIMTGADDRACSFASWCRGRFNAEFRRIWEPLTPTENY